MTSQLIRPAAFTLVAPAHHRVAPDPAPPAAADPAPPCALTLLGGFHLHLDGHPVALGPNAQRLLAVLVCLGRQAPRSTVAQLLWPDNRTSRAHANLRTTLYRLQRVLPDLVLSSKTDLRLAPAVGVDIEQIRTTAISLLTAHPDDPLWTSRPDWAQFTEDLLPAWDDEWLADHQFSYRRMRLDALERLSALFVGNGLHGAAVQAALAVLQADELRDTAHETLIRAYLAQGNRNDAIVQFGTYRRLLRDELGLEPPEALDRLLWSHAA
ncbi:BTAD domain-containing putative transcriptional regulator [Amycolatopsis sp. A133]|uniref:AfsR/SARP family transcriptional regulator n=1 Tax=Amycolatopsis sp. A133 TaxID=3064472 RepID=UPI0027FA8BEA|nr:BTAD domain-containing putative transcriptional regulator [Amycolatopsis sp. A133]MDQ7808749.1 BTAD domain-containing putative transcriptional regulator [Amycolatopsis sp. A133]